MKYAVLVYEAAEDFGLRHHPERQGAYWGAYAAYNEALKAGGVAAPGGNALMAPDAATTIRVRGGQKIVQDGPFADTKEQLGGLWVIDVPDLDAALAWASRCPSALTGSVEVRPILEMSGG